MWYCGCFGVGEVVVVVAAAAAAGGGVYQWRMSRNYLPFIGLSCSRHNAKDQQQNAENFHWHHTACSLVNDQQWLSELSEEEHQYYTDRPIYSTAAQLSVSVPTLERCNWYSEKVSTIPIPIRLPTHLPQNATQSAVLSSKTSCLSATGSLYKAP